MISKSQEKIAREKFELAANDFDFVFHSPYALTETLSVFTHRYTVIIRRAVKRRSFTGESRPGHHKSNHTVWYGCFFLVSAACCIAFPIMIYRFLP